MQTSDMASKIAHLPSGASRNGTSRIDPFEPVRETMRVTLERSNVRARVEGDGHGPKSYERVRRPRADFWTEVRPACFLVVPVARGALRRPCRGVSCGRPSSPAVP